MERRESRKAEVGSGSAGLSGVEGIGAGEKIENCPGVADWGLLFGEDQGAMDGGYGSVDGLLAHAAGCAVCAERLLVFSRDLSADETALISQLNTASAAGQDELARRLAETPRASAANVIRMKAGVRGASRHYLWSGTGMAAALLIGLGLLVWWRVVNRPDRLLAAAYTQSRAFDLRIPGAGFAEVTPQDHLRGGRMAPESSKLQQANARIGRHLKTVPDDPLWLEFEARSEILEEKFDAAIDILDKLEAAGPVTANLLLDDATAYYERGLATDSENDRAMALESLRHADELAPDDPVVLFNEALVLENQGQLMSAVETWNRYLRFERDPRWQAAGQRRLQRLEEKLKELRSQQRLKNQ
jgi:tetratricopeptide (TPR) repeat protein